MQSTDSIENYAYATSKDLVTEKEEVKCNIITKQLKKWLTLMMLQSELATNSWSSIQNIDNWRLSIWKNKFIF